MRVLTLYRGEGYSYGLTGTEPSGMVRLVADEGMALTDGTDFVSAIDIPPAEQGLWSEVEAPPEPMTEEQALAELEVLLSE